MAETRRKRSFPKIAAAVAALAGSAALIVALVMGGYTPFYRQFLQPERGLGFAEPLPPIEGIEYVARVSPALYRGAYPVENLPALKELGIKTFINLRYLKTHDYGDQARALGFNYFWMPIHPGEPPDQNFIREFLARIDDPNLQPVYVHCTLGIDRTGLMMGIRRIEREGWDNARAVAEMEWFGHNELWIDLEEALKNYRKLEAP